MFLACSFLPPLIQLTGETIGEVRAVSGMHQRKAEMARQADAFIALPGIESNTWILRTCSVVGTVRFIPASNCLHIYAGGYGTLEELLEVITWAQLGIHDKPVISLHHFRWTGYMGARYQRWTDRLIDQIWLSIVLQVGLLNVDGYYNSLLTFIDKAVDEGFVTPAARHIIVSAPTALELLTKLEVYLNRIFLPCAPWLVYVQSLFSLARGKIPILNARYTRASGQ